MIEKLKKLFYAKSKMNDPYVQYTVYFKKNDLTASLTDKGDVYIYDESKKSSALFSDSLRLDVNRANDLAGLLYDIKDAYRKLLEHGVKEKADA